MLFTILDQRRRNPQFLQSGSVSVPNTVNGRRFLFRVLLSSADLLDTTLTVRYALQGSVDPLTMPWMDLFRGVWQGGTDVDGNPTLPPHPGWQTSGDWPPFVRGELEWTQRVSIGLEVEVL